METQGEEERNDHDASDTFLRESGDRSIQVGCTQFEESRLDEVEAAGACQFGRHLADRLVGRLDA